MAEQQIHEKYMRRALELAKKGAGRTSPNPMVGCVVVKDGKIVAEGYHEHVGGFHAERNALTHCKEDVGGADLYVTLEPCCHFGRTPPCTDIIIERHIGRVIIGSLDVDPRVKGKSVKILEDAGIKVITGVLTEECEKLNEVFFHYMTHHTPFVVAKYAMSLDGKIACASGDAKWVTGETARHEVQKLRKRYSGIMVGIGTVFADDPMLNCRIEAGGDPTRIICDTKLQIPPDSKIVSTAKDIPTIAACGEDALKSDMLKVVALQAAGVQLMAVAVKNHHLDLKDLMQKLAAREIDSILLEGGGTLNASAFEAGIVNKVIAFVAPKIIGGEYAKSPVAGVGAQKMADAVQLKDVITQMFGDDIAITGYPVYSEKR